jgi:hypothetical protein
MGIDPANLTLRKLVWMAKERRHIMGEIAAWQITWLVALLTDQRLTPGEINPYESTPVAAKRPAASESNSRAVWKAIRAKAFRVRSGETPR